MSKTTRKREDIAKNNVSSKGQVQDNDIVRPVFRDGKLNVLFLGNSITRHAPAEDIGWFGVWGMSASAEKNDYVHLTVDALDKKYGKVNYCTVSCADWEREYVNLKDFNCWCKAMEFNADIIVVRFGENIYNSLGNEKGNLANYLNDFINYFNRSGKAKIIVTGLFWQSDTIEKAFYEVAKQNGYDFIPLCDIGKKDENKALGQFWHSGVALHPNDRGMKLISQRILEKM